jgi:hypothetical protein
MYLRQFHSASTRDTLKAPAGRFINVLKVEETTPLEPGHRDVKRYAPGVGLLQDGSLKLVRLGKWTPCGKRARAADGVPELL